MPLLQGHEEVWRSGTHEAVVHNEAMHRCEFAVILLFFLMRCVKSLKTVFLGSRVGGLAISSVQDGESIDSATVSHGK